jgi:hypothetical protein
LIACVCHPQQVMILKQHARELLQEAEPLPCSILCFKICITACSPTTKHQWYGTGSIASSLTTAACTSSPS